MGCTLITCGPLIAHPCRPSHPPLKTPPPQGDANYPGGWLFDPLGLSADAQRYEAMRVREIKNGRLAMVAWLGFAAQAAATRDGPVGNLEEALRALRSGGAL